MVFHIGALFLLGSLSVSHALPPCVCTRNLKPVCGSDSQTYGNQCMLECAQLSNPQLFLERAGPCGAGGSNLGPPRDIRQAPGACNACTLEYSPLCGTDGKTYPNRCSLNCAEPPGHVQVAYPGPCRNKREITTQSSSSCVCPDNLAPLCGTDGVTYDNPCLLKCAKDNDDDLDMLYEGECADNIKVLSPQDCEGCIRNVRPVCGTDGNTYRNPCMVNCLRENDESLHIDYPGPCDSRLTILNPLACDNCTRIVKPVCGTDGKTYRNPCMFSCARKDDDSLHIYYEGPCDKVIVVEEAGGSPCGCTTNLEPVCASNGVTFSNTCFMKCAGSDLTVAKEGPCEE